MLIIDEFYSLLVGTPRLQRQVMNAIKMLCNELQIPIVGVGTKDAIRVLHTHPQHASRFDVAELPTWKLDQVIDWQPIEQYLNRQKTVTSEAIAVVPPIPCYPCSKPSCSDNGTASPIPNSNTASSPTSTSTCFAVLTN